MWIPLYLCCVVQILVKSPQCIDSVCKCALQKRPFALCKNREKKVELNMSFYLLFVCAKFST